MAYNRMHASKLCNETEFKLFSASLAPELERLPMRSVQANIKRVRTARDKHSDLLRRQTIGVRRGAAAKTAPTAAVNTRTEQKVKLFDEALKRFEARFAQLQAVPATVKTTPGAGARPAKAKAKAKGGAVVAATKKATAKPVVAKKPAAKKVVDRKPVSKKPVATKPLKKLVAKKVAVKKSAASKHNAAVGEAAPKKPVRSSKAPAKQPPKSAKAGTARAKTPSIEVKAQMQRVSAHQRTSNAKSQARRNQR